MSIIESLGPTAATLGSGFFVGILIGYALRKVIKIVAVIAGLFLAGLAYLQYHQVANINWNKLQQVSEGALTTVANLTMEILVLVVVVSMAMLLQQAAATTTSFPLAMTSFGIPLAGSMSAGFSIGFMKG